MMHYWNNGWHMGWMVLWWIVIAAAIAGVLWLLYRSALHRGSADDVLKQRYARGEIDRETFRRMHEDLHS